MNNILRRGAVALTLMFASSVAVASPQFSILKDCQTLAALQQYAERDNITKNDCRSAQGEVEGVVFEKQSGIPGTHVCILRHPPAAVADWSCERELDGKSKTLTCWEAVPDDVDQEISSEGDTYGPVISQYLVEANGCPQAMRDAATVSLSLPPNLNSVATAGKTMFAEKLRSTRAGADFVLEGYARFSGIVHQTSRYIHYIMVGSEWIEPKGGYGNVIPSKDSLDLPWQIENSSQDPDFKNFERHMNALLPRGFSSFAMSISISRTTASARNDEERRFLINFWASDLSGALDLDDYDDLSERKYKEATGMDYADLRERMRQAAPAGMASQIADQMSASLFLKTRRGPTCDKDVYPNMFIGVLPLYPLSHDVESYGQIIIYSVVGSPCASDVHHLEEMQRHSAQRALNKLEEEIRGTE